MYTLGLTGSIAMGKTTVARMLEDLGVPVFHSDESVHDLFANSRRVKKEIRNAFPGAFANGKIDREKLASIVFERPQDLHRLEMIVHPAVLKESRKFLNRHRKNDAPIVALDMPLLFEIRAEDLCDGTLVVSASEKNQTKRLKQRKNMSQRRINMILGRQMPDEEKRRRADFLIETDGPKKQTREKVEKLVAKLRKKAH